MSVALVTGAASGIGAAPAWMVSTAAATITGIALSTDGSRSA